MTYGTDEDSEEYDGSWAEDTPYILGDVVCDKCGKHPALPNYSCPTCAARCCDACAPAGMGVPCLDCEEPER